MVWRRSNLDNPTWTPLPGYRLCGHITGCLLECCWINRLFSRDLFLCHFVDADRIRTGPIRIVVGDFGLAKVTPAARSDRSASAGSNTRAPPLPPPPPPPSPPFSQ